jgi:hypothetical protein
MKQERERHTHTPGANGEIHFLSVLTLFRFDSLDKHYDHACKQNIIKEAKSSSNEMKQAEEKIRYAEIFRCEAEVCLQCVRVTL